MSSANMIQQLFYRKLLQLQIYKRNYWKKEQFFLDILIIRWVSQKRGPNTRTALANCLTLIRTRLFGIRTTFGLAPNIYITSQRIIKLKWRSKSNFSNAAHRGSARHTSLFKLMNMFLLKQNSNFGEETAFANLGWWTRNQLYHQLIRIRNWPEQRSTSWRYNEICKWCTVFNIRSWLNTRLFDSLW